MAEKHLRESALIAEQACIGYLGNNTDPTRFKYNYVIVYGQQAYIIIPNCRAYNLKVSKTKA